MAYTKTTWVDDVTPVSALNMNKIEQGIADAHTDLLNKFGAASTAGTLDWNHTTNTQPGTSPTLLLGDAPNGPGPSLYFHALNFEYGSKNGSGQITQFAVPYSTVTTNKRMFFRTRYTGTWSNWSEMWSSGNDGAGSGLDADMVDGIESSRLVYGSSAVGTNDWTTGVNNIARSGFYYILGTFSGLPVGAAVNGYLLHTHYTTGYACQIFTPFDDRGVYRRTQIAGAWGAWKGVGGMPVGKPRSVSVNTVNNTWVTVADVSGTQGRLELLSAGGTLSSIDFRVTIDGNVDILSGTSANLDYISAEKTQDAIYFHNSMKLEVRTGGTGTSQAQYRLAPGTP